MVIVIRKGRRTGSLVKLAKSKTFEQVISEIRCKIKPEDNGAKVSSTRKTKADGVLIEFGLKTTNQNEICIFSMWKSHCGGSHRAIRKETPTQRERKIRWVVCRVWMQRAKYYRSLDCRHTSSTCRRSDKRRVYKKKRILRSSLGASAETFTHIAGSGRYPVLTTEGLKRA